MPSFLPTTNRFRCWSGLFCSLAMLVLLAGPVLAQLTPDQVAELQRRGAREGWTFTVSDNPATLIPLNDLCGAVEPADWQSKASWDPCTPRRDLPESFDWRDIVGAPDVRSQGACGSCWAFAAMGAFEYGILVETGLAPNLSEQWLVSCTDAGDCSGGWHTSSFDYMCCIGQTDPCGDSGPPPEMVFPYHWDDLPCECPYPLHLYCMDNWAVVGVPWEVPSPEQIKQAIVDHGPVATCVLATDALQAYNGGVFNECQDGGWINHVVVLVGWDDTLGTDGVWIMRNSWGRFWGEEGYMYIEYGCNNIGYATCYIDYTQPDCNENGVRDAEDILAGTSIDCNENRIPDECDVANGLCDDCNENGVPDSCDVAWPMPALADDLPAVLGWTDIAASGTEIVMDDDDAEGIAAPFTNPMFDSPWIMVANDGAIGWGGAPSVSTNNRTIPSPGLFGGVPALAPLWDDLAIDTGGVYYQVIGSAPYRTLVVQWQDRGHTPADFTLDGDEVTFQVQVYERPVDNIWAQFLYQDTDFQDAELDNGASASIGLQLDGTLGEQWSFNEPDAVMPETVLSVVSVDLPAEADDNLNGIPDSCESPLGDMNCDGFLNFDDVDGFVLALAGSEDYAEAYPNCDYMRADCDENEEVNFDDIDDFVDLMVGVE